MVRGQCLLSGELGRLAGLIRRGRRGGDVARFRGVCAPWRDWLRDPGLMGWLCAAELWWDAPCASWGSGGKGFSRTVALCLEFCACLPASKIWWFWCAPWATLLYNLSLASGDNLSAFSFSLRSLARWLWTGIFEGGWGPEGRACALEPTLCSEGVFGIPSGLEVYGLMTGFFLSDSLLVDIGIIEPPCLTILDGTPLLSTRGWRRPRSLSIGANSPCVERCPSTLYASELWCITWDALAFSEL